MFKRIIHLIKKLWCLKVKKDSIKWCRIIGVNIGENCRILDDPNKMFGSEPWLVKVGDNVSVSFGTRFICHEGALWCLRNKAEFKNKDYFSPIVVGNNVFIGTYVVIMPGVTIGDNAIIGASSVATKNVESNSVVAEFRLRRFAI